MSTFARWSLGADIAPFTNMRTHMILSGRRARGAWWLRSRSRLDQRGFPELWDDVLLSRSVYCADNLQGRRHVQVSRMQRRPADPSRAREDGYQARRCQQVPQGDAQGAAQVPQDQAQGSCQAINISAPPHHPSPCQLSPLIERSATCLLISRLGLGIPGPRPFCTHSMQSVH